MKKLVLACLACFVVFTMTATLMPDTADARRGGYKSPASSFKKQDAPSQNSNVQKSNTTKNSNTGAATGARGGGFMGGGFMKGMMIGGLAGMLFGGLLGGMGMFGELLGLLINLFAIFAVVILAMNVYHYFKRRKEQNEKRINP